MKYTLNLETLPEIAKLLAAGGWIIYEYKVVDSNSVSLTIYHEGEKESGSRTSRRGSTGL